MQRAPHGLLAHAPAHALRLTAQAPGVLRIEAAPDAAFPDLPSEAVLPEPRAGRCAVRHEADGFALPGLRVRLAADAASLRVEDEDGRVLLADAPGVPLAFGAHGFRARKARPAGTSYYGLGDKPGGIDRSGRAFRLWNTDDPHWGEQSDLLYKSIPFVIGLRDGRAWGLLLDTTWRSHFDFGVAEPDVLAFGAAGGAFDAYLLAGPAPRDVLARYVALVGRMKLPPLWALGYHQCRFSYGSAARVREVVARHRAEAIPLDAIWLDIGFQDRNRPFTANPATFPDLAGLVRETLADGVRTVAITDLHVAAAPGEGYAPCDSGLAGDHFLRGADGAPYVGESWPGPAHFPEFGLEATRAWWGGLYEGFYLRDGIAGFWNDMNEPSVRDGLAKTMPPDLPHRRDGAPPATHAELHNAYGMQNTRATEEGLLALDPSRRPFVLTRASFAGGHRHAATWTGDNASTWQHLRLSVPQLLSLGLSGFALAGADVGGFGGSPSPELLTRWIQLGAFTPFFRNHTDRGTADQEAWVHGEAHTRLRRDAIAARYRLLPYLYAAMEEASRTGLPAMRPMFVDYPGQGLDRVDTQFLLGDALLVAPWPDETLDPYPLHLPPGTRWFDYWTGHALPEGAVSVDKRLDRLAVFARAGSIVAHQGDTLSTAVTPSGPLVLHVYPGAAGETSLYADDGISHAFRGGACYRRRLSLDREGTLHLAPPEGSFPPWWDGLEIVLHGAAAAARIEADGRRVDTVWDGARRALRARLPEAVRRVRAL